MAAPEQSRGTPSVVASRAPVRTDRSAAKVVPRVMSSVISIAATLIFTVVLSGCEHPESSGTGQEHAMEIEAIERDNRSWRERRLERLTEPYGWLSLIGLVMLDSAGNDESAGPRRFSVGSDADSDIPVPRGPARWGDLVVDGSSVEFVAAENVDVRIDGERSKRAALHLDGPDGPTRIEAEDLRLHLVDPGGRIGLRVRDPRASTRQEFVGLEYYDIDPAWRVRARFVEHPPGTTMKVANVMGQILDEPNPGKAVFERDGKSWELEAVASDDKLFFIFADRTSGRETYGLGRFLYAELPSEGAVVLDFNQSYNPPCAFNAFTTCPLPPQSNRIDGWVRAGELKYKGPEGISTAGSLSGPGASRS